MTDYIKCQRKDCKEEGRYWYPLDGMIYNLCKKHWEWTNKNREKFY